MMNFLGVDCCRVEVDGTEMMMTTKLALLAFWVLLFFLASDTCVIEMDDQSERKREESGRKSAI